MTVGYARVLYPLSVDLKVIVVVSEKHTAFGMSISELNRVESTKETDLLRSRDIDSTSSKTLRNHRVDVLVKMKANRPWHPLP
jgi:hypothetical protein